MAEMMHRVAVEIDVTVSVDVLNPDAADTPKCRKAGAGTFLMKEDVGVAPEQIAVGGTPPFDLPWPFAHGPALNSAIRS